MLVHTAALFNRTEMVSLLLSDGHLANHPAGEISVGNIACRNGNLKMVEILLAYNVDIGLYDSRNTPIGYAVKRGHKQLVEVLLASNAQRPCNSDFGAAVLKLRFDIASLLLTSGM